MDPIDFEADDMTAAATTLRLLAQAAHYYEQRQGHYEWRRSHVQAQLAREDQLLLPNDWRQAIMILFNDPPKYCTDTETQLFTALAQLPVSERLETYYLLVDTVAKARDLIPLLETLQARQLRPGQDLGLARRRAGLNDLTIAKVFLWYRYRWSPLFYRTNTEETLLAHNTWQAFVANCALIQARLKSVI